MGCKLEMNMFQWVIRYNDIHLNRAGEYKMEGVLISTEVRNSLTSHDAPRSSGGLTHAVIVQ